MPDETLRARLDAATKQLEAPLAVVDLDAFDRNADDLVRRADGRPIRVASKSVRCRYLLERVLRKDGFEGVMAYSLPEALWLAREWAGTDLAQVDILVAYPTVDHTALRQLADDDHARGLISIMVDSIGPSGRGGRRARHRAPGHPGLPRAGRVVAARAGT